MINSKIFKLSALILFVSFFCSHQFVFAQTTSEVSPISPTNSSDVTKVADTKVNQAAHGPLPKLTSAEIEVLDKKSRARSIIEKLRLREITSIKWPADLVESSEDRGMKFNDVTEKKMALDKKCRMFATRYSNDAKKNLGIRTGILNLDSVCEGSMTSLKNIKNIDDEAFLELGPVIVERFDRTLYAYYNSNNFKMDKVYDKSLFGLVGIPVYFSGILIQSLALLSLILNFFILYKLFRN